MFMKLEIMKQYIRVPIVLEIRKALYKAFYDGG